jgi:N-acetylglucosaminyl-diphospho-decaprenol L-rhamnosyltransferase
LNTVDVTAIVVNYNTEGLLKEAIGRLYAAGKRIRTNIVIVDNASRDSSVALLRTAFPECTLIVNSANVGFGRANNQALDQVHGRYVLLLNTDAFIAPETLERTVAYMDAHPRCGILGAKLVGGDGTLQPSARSFPTPWNLFVARAGLTGIFPWTQLVDDLSADHTSARQCDWVPGCYYLVRRTVIEQIGLFDPRFFLYYEEVDHCYAAKRAGWEIVCHAATTVIHLGGESAKSDGEIMTAGRQIPLVQLESEILYFRKNYGVAAIWLHLILISLADVINIIKALLKAAPNVCAHGRHLAFAWATFKRTRWGVRPTR